MASLDNCFVDNVTVPVQLIDVGVPLSVSSDGGQEPISQPCQIRCSGPQELARHLDTVKDNDYTCRYISVSQRTSWRPLQVTKPMLDLIVSRHNIDASFWELPSCFYTRNREVEQVFCIPYTESRNGSSIEISYTVKYPEYKPSEQTWVVRHSGIYHRYTPATSQSTYVLFSPIPNSKAHQKAEEWLLSHHQEAAAEPFWLHRVLFATYYPAWRQYIASLENQLLPIANKTFSTFINEPLGIGYDHLSELVSIEKQLLQVPSILGLATDILKELNTLLGSISSTAATHAGTLQLKNHQRQCAAYSRTAAHLQQRAQITAQLLSDTLLFRDQVVAKQQNENMLRLNKSAVFITTLSLLYLPASFVASLFGSNFFALDTETHTVVSTPMIWIFVVSAVGLTTCTFLFYYWLLQRDGAMFRRLEPKISKRITQDWNFRELTRRLTANEKSANGAFPMSPA